MIKCKVKRGKNGRLKVSGTSRNVMVETAAIIHEIYVGIKKQNQEAAKSYKEHLIAALLDPNSIVWKEENHNG